MVGGNPRTDWLALLKKEESVPTEKVPREQESTLRKPRTGGGRKEQNMPAHRKPRARQKMMAPLTAEEAYEEMSNPDSGAGVQAGLYRAGRIKREDAIEWIACAIIYRRVGTAAFAGWQRHKKAVEEALERFCGGET